MLIFYIIIFCSFFIGMRVNHVGFFEDFLEREQTDAIKGFFIMLVFLSHSMMEIREAGFNPVCAMDAVGYRIHSEMGQLVVVSFLFYSGFGVMESIKKKGKEYLDHFPRRRLLNTLLNFDIAVLCFVVLNLFMGVKMDLRQIGWSLIGWDSVGNSNWYIFVILFCYLVSWISGKMHPYGGWKAVAMTTFLVLLGEAILSFLKHGQSWWYNTILCYPAGMFLSLYKETVVSFFRKYYFLVLGLLLTLFLFLHFQKWIPAIHGLSFNVQSIVFALLIVLTTMKIKIGNRFLVWAGMCVFPIYIYQRLPMRAFRHWAGEGWLCSNPYLFILLCALFTVCISLYYKNWQIKLT